MSGVFSECAEGEREVAFRQDNSTSAGELTVAGSAIWLQAEAGLAAARVMITGMVAALLTLVLRRT